MCSLLLDREEVLALESTILGKVSAVNGIAASVNTETCSQSVRAQALCNLGVHGSNKVTEGLDGIFLADL